MTTSTKLAVLTDEAEATRRIRECGHDIAAAEPAYVRHKPGETTIVAYRLLGVRSETWAYAQWCHDRQRADEIHHKATTLRPRIAQTGPGLARLDEHTVLYAFPNDARLRRLRWYTTPQKIKRSLEALVGPGDRIRGSRTRVEVLRYKPERRVVARIDLATNDRTTPLLVRYTTTQQARHIADLAQHLRGHGVAAPAPLAQLDHDRVTIDEFIEGTQLRDAVRAGGADPKAVAEAINAFHGAPPTGSMPVRTPVDELQRCRLGLDGLGDWYPAVAQAAAETMANLERHLPEARSQVTLHGDLHTKNILVDRQRVAFVDLERVAVGSAAIDLGFLTAHAIALGIRQPGWSPTATAFTADVVDAYRRRTERIEPSALAWHTALGLVEQALLVVRHLEQGWPRTSVELLAAANHQLTPHRPLSGEKQ